ncbi:MAG: efflux RND transporter periplasmic adaptor subunit [Bacteroidia bacterium]|nr:efflux RND transporter periplasmic adaptor subunit [Bacteroidia bacterium]
MKKKILTGIVIVLIVALLALPKLNIFGSKDNGTSAQQETPRLPVEVMVVKPGRLDNKLVVTGSVLPNESLELKPEESGKITGIFFKEGTRVGEGDLLLQINDKEIKAQIEKQRENQKLFESIERRQKALLDKEAISQEEYDNALNRLNTTISDIRLLEAQYEKTRLTAPFGGMIGLRYVSEGAYVTPTTVVATLYNISQAKIEFAVPGRYSTQVKAGKRILFTVESDTIQYTGEVYAVEPRIDPDTRTLKIRALAGNAKGDLLPGQFVKVTLILNTNNNAILVPTQAVVPEQGGQKVYIMKNGRAEEVRVQTGLRTETDLEIVSGLNTNDSLITTGLLQLRPGMEVQVSNIMK